MSASAFGNGIFTSLLLLVAFFQPGFTLFLDWDCGLPAAPVAYAKRIVNGFNAGISSSPWMAFIQTRDDFFICGGTLITNRLILTAAHCYYSHRHLKAILGEYDLKANDSCYVTVDGDQYCTSRVKLNVDMGIMHPRYNSKTVDNDIAILRLASRVDYTANIRPICIVTDKTWRNRIDEMETLTATGWGFTRPGGKMSMILKTLDIRRQPPDICNRFVDKTPSYNEFCVGNLDSGLCNGDSGGPVGRLIQYGVRARFIQVGIASLANQQCDYASIFTDVLSHVDWILSVEEQYGHGLTQPVLVRSMSRRYPSRVVPIYNIIWPRFSWPIN